ncbi:MAG: diiron oxygenase [Saprospiraceae bacterium]
MAISNNLQFEAIAERLIKISTNKPLNPETFIPWDHKPTKKTIYLPPELISLQGNPLWHTLSIEQQLELGRLEVVQVMYSYAWSETLACHFFNRHLLTLNPNSVEYRFLIREIIEEYQHQEMFGKAIRAIHGEPILPGRMHKLFGNITVKYLPASLVFMSVLAIELMADQYAKKIRSNEDVFSILRKTSELHHIEEGRHILYTEEFLKKFTYHSGFFKQSIYSIIILLNLYFMRTLYVKEKFYKEIKIENYHLYYKEAINNYKNKFALIAMDAIKEFVQSIHGFNWITKPIWNLILKTNL